MATTFFEDLLKEKPKVPAWENMDPSQVQLDTTTGNLASFTAAKELAQQYNDFEAQQVAKRLASSMPYLSNLESTAADVYGKRLRGELSTSDAAASQRSSAARALGLGIAGSPAASALTLRDLGLKQYGVQSEALAGLPGFTSSMAALHKAPTFDFSTVFMSPAQRWQMQFQNQENRWNTQWLKNQVDAMPSGIAWAFARQGDEDIEMAKQFAVSYFSGGMGGQPGGAAQPR